MTYMSAKEFRKNRLTFGEVVGKSLVSCFFPTRGVVKTKRGSALDE